MRPRALVTGAAARVGRAIALELASNGFDLVVHHRSNPAGADAVVAACKDAGADAIAVAADLSEPSGVEHLATSVRERWDQLHVLVNNASIFEPVPFADIDLAQWDHMQAINVRAPFHLSQALLPLMHAADGAAIGAPAGQRAVVVHLCDIGAERPVRGYAHYSVSKAALVMLVKAMAVELAPAIRTVGVSPGHVAWPEHYDGSLRASLSRRIPLGRAGEPGDIARLVRFLVLEAPYVNGAVIPVDGGLGARY